MYSDLNAKYIIAVLQVDKDTRCTGFCYTHCKRVQNMYLSSLNTQERVLLFIMHSAEIQIS